MASHPRVDTAILAGSSVIAADQIMQAARDHKELHAEDATSHYVKAAIAGAVAIGAYEMLRKDGEVKEDLISNIGRRDEIERDDRENDHPHGHGSHHERHVLEEALGAYALGRQMMGHKQHPILKLIAEALGAYGLYHEAKKDL